MAPIVSVIVTCFNDDPGHLAACLNSVAAQTIEPDKLEVILVDDGSESPSTRGYLADLARTGVVVLRQSNRGPSAARNAGISVAQGFYILTLDGDDTLSEDFVAAGVSLMDGSDARFAYGDVRLFDHGHDDVKQLAPSLALADFMLDNQATSCGLFRRSDWQRLGGYDEDLRRGYEDYEWWVRLLADGGAALKIPGASLGYRQRPGSRSQAASRASSEALAITRARIVSNNAPRLPALLVAAFHRIDQQQEMISSLRTELQWWDRHFGLARRFLARLLHPMRR